MLSFKDKLGRQWICRVDVAAIRRVRALCNLDLANSIVVHPDGTADTNVLQALASDPCLLVDTVFAVCKDQADRLAVTDVQFAEGLDGDTIEAATLALMEGIVEFFPLPKRRLLTKILDVVKQQRQQEQTRLETMEQDGTLDTLLASALASSATSSPPAPASLP
jgi:hypothetical protein